MKVGRERNRETIRAYGVRRLGLFGSCARGESSSNSDLDFVVEFDKKSFDGYMGVKDSLEDLFDCPVDLVIETAIKPRLREVIRREAVHATGIIKSMRTTFLRRSRRLRDLRLVSILIILGIFIPQGDPAHVLS